MTREQYIKTLHRQLALLNQKIDLKIISGQDYKNEARKHKMLLREMKKHTAGNFFKKLFPFFFQF